MKTRTCHRLLFLKAIAGFLLMLIGSACSDSSSSSRPIPAAEAGFVDIESVSYTLTGSAYTSSQSRVFYSFHRASEDPADKPLFVFVNGGPGAGTTDGLLSFNTAPMSSDLLRYEDEPVYKNPYSWARMGNLLYIDAPLTGYAYNFFPQGVAVPEHEFDLKNCNPFIDASQVLRTVLRFMKKHPEIQKNPVILVGESYGGTRTTAMLHMMLFYASYGSADGAPIYRDQALATEIDAHLDTVFPENASGTHAPEEVALQFGRHIMIEPQLTGRYQSELTGIEFEKPGSVIFQIAEETGTVYTPCPQGDDTCDPMQHALDFVLKTAGRDMYKYDDPWWKSWVVSGFSEAWLNFIETASTLLQTDVRGIGSFYAAQRRGAYKFYKLLPGEGTITPLEEWASYPAMPPDMKASITMFLDHRDQIEAEVAETVTAAMAGGSGYTYIEDVFGELAAWDLYYSWFMNFDVLNGFYTPEAVAAEVDPENPRYGRMFLENLPFVEVMITDAPFDLSVYSSVLPYSFEKYTDVVDWVDVDSPCPGCDRYFTIRYRRNCLPRSETPQQRTVFFPFYKESGHMVSSAMPEKLMQDVAQWIQP